MYRKPSELVEIDEASVVMHPTNVLTSAAASSSFHSSLDEV